MIETPVNILLAMSSRIFVMLARMKSLRILVAYTRISSTALRLLVDYRAALHRQLMRSFAVVASFRVLSDVASLIGHFRFRIE